MKGMVVRSKVVMLAIMTIQVPPVTINFLLLFTFAALSWHHLEFHNLAFLVSLDQTSFFTLSFTEGKKSFSMT